jgi:hypothetical protein
LVAVALGVLVLGSAALALGAVPGQRTFRAGAAIVDISPRQFPVIVNAMFTERSARQTIDPLFVRGLVLDDGSERIAIAVVDTCMMPRELIDRAKELAAQGTGLRVDRMLVSATHTHSAPSAMGCLGSRADPAYVAYLPGQIAEAIRLAASRLEPAQVGWATIDAPGHTFNRRWILRPDRMSTDPFGQRSVRANMHPGHQSPDAIGPSGPVDSGLSLLAIRSQRGEALAVLANFSMHYYESPLLSSDYFGRYCDQLATRLGSASKPVVMMSQGTSGDLMWMDYSQPRHQIGYDQYAQELSELSFQALQGVTCRDWVPLRMRERRLTLRFRVPDRARLDWARQVVAGMGERLPATLSEVYAHEQLYLHARPKAELKVQALRIGDVGVAAIPNEVFAITGLKIKEASPLQPSFVVELANGAEGYIPPPEQHRLGGYTTWPARTAGLEPMAEPRITEAVLGLLESVAGRPRRPEADRSGPYTRAVLASRPLAYWPMDEASAEPARDLAGGKRSGRYRGGVAFYLDGPDLGAGESGSPKPANRAPHFAGGYFECELGGVGANYSVEFWFWNGLASGVRGLTGTLFQRGDGDALVLGGTNAAPGKLILEAGQAAGRVVAEGRSAIGWRSWHHVALVRHGGFMRVYLNGAPECDLAAVAPPASRFRLRRFRFGAGAGARETLEGKLDEVAVFSRALTAEEVRGHAARLGSGH